VLPDVLDDLYTAVRVQLAGALGVTADEVEPLHGVAVRLGPLRADLDVPDAIGVAVDATAEEIEPMVGQTLGALGSTVETWLLTCVCQSGDGKDDLMAATRRVWWLRSQLKAALPGLLGPALSGAPALGVSPGTWEAEEVSHSYRPARTDAGALALVEVTIRVQTIEQETRSE
jgi:hypothetical protein